ncbi:phosphohydrolase [Brevibacillus choshinensis]|uniref:Phosphohydrolase n=1 Tax=Brevibacillus choshinensis TaxID=54911 RepID=A0ABR5N4N0_BRECH|nr:HD-GYP domain-containing protein [Brevibacillus choshinensis]KQL45534.1 phosphohydrolase [Brevibacillus choshinensis]
MFFRSILGPIFAVIFPFLLFGYLRMDTALDRQIVLPSGHFYIVSSVAILGIVIAISVGVAGSRLRNIKVTLLSLAFLSLAAIFAVHGLSTPHFLLHETHLPGVAAQVSILLATFWLWLSSFTTDRPLIEYLSHQQRLLLPVWALILTSVGTVSMFFPHLVDVIQLDSRPINWLLTLTTILLNSITMYRYYHSYQYSQFPLQLSIVYSSGWLITSQLIMQLGETWRISWWIYHFLLLASMIVMIVGLIRQYAMKQSLAGALRALFTTDPIERITNSISPSVKALVIATETKDRYTAGHNFRVTMYALKLGEELKLKPDQLRALAQGTIIHDVGKLNIPDSILNKPGKLSTEERALIEMHTVKGYEMCKNLGFMKDELSIIRSHHEKWDGSGYPDHLQGKNIPLMARIVSVADVYDALTSNRAYRTAWSHQEAIAFLLKNKGSHFDGSCVEAWVRVCERDPSVYQYPAMMINDDTSISLVSSKENVHHG